MLSFFSTDVLVGFLESEWLSLQDLFSKVSPFSADFSPTKHLMHAYFMDLPPALASEPLVRQLASLLGNLVCYDFDFDLPGRLDVISCLISFPFNIGP